MILVGLPEADASVPTEVGRSELAPEEFGEEPDRAGVGRSDTFNSTSSDPNAAADMPADEGASASDPAFAENVVRAPASPACALSPVSPVFPVFPVGPLNPFRDCSLAAMSATRRGGANRS
jgi:hypothetical protein